MYRIGIDVGGTFTDFVSVREGESPRYFKTPSTPQEPAVALISGLSHVAEDYGLSVDTLLKATDVLIHGSTVATNTLVERKGAKVGLITTDGFRDLLEMREGMKEDRYNLKMSPIEPLVPRHLRIAVPERVRSDGTVEIELDQTSITKALDYFRREGIESLAVCFLFSFLNPEHEQKTADAIRQAFPQIRTSLSHEVLPQIKEFDRVSTTVVDSYVGPVFSRYLLDLEEKLGAYSSGQDILIMQSNGGVAPINESKRLAVRAILSGPAGGTSGTAHYGKLLGESKIIGFDMGGTSTDISLIEDGAPHLTTERFEAGWKIAVPMIDIHTLGAGGGSIARVDPGGILHVGPDSAGADPGPACYGRGGLQPTVTDANLVLGYLDPENFLGGRSLLQKDLAEYTIAETIAPALGLSTEGSALGIHRVVSTSIAEGIRLMSVQRGVDPREFAILGFGGAAGLHASSVARQLGIGTVYLPTAGPVLSAHGMLSTDLQYDFSRSFPTRLEGIDLQAVRSILDELESEGRDRLHSRALSNDDIHVVMSADMRYLDQIYEVNVPIPDLSQDADELVSEWAANFHQRYEDLYSYSQMDQEIRLVNLRISVYGRLPRLDPPNPTESNNPTGGLKGTRSIYTSEWNEVPVYDSKTLPSDAQVDGPAILESDYTTILVQTDDVARVDRYGGIELLVAVGPASSSSEQVATVGEPDPITLAVVERRLESVALEMMEVMLRTAMSQILNSSRDFSTAILDAECQLIAQGEGTPVHISALPVAVEAVREYFGDDINDGDLFALNDPYFGGSHLPDITVIKPIFHDGRLLFYGVNRAHHSDIGGATHGGYNPAASEIYHEGLRIPPLRIYDCGDPRQDLLQMLSANVRHPENFLGDLNAQIGSVDTAAKRIRGLLASYGPDLLTSSVNAILTATERRVREFISDWPDGIYNGESLIDDDGFDSKLVPIHARITIAGDQMTVDLSDSSPQVTGFINSAYANTRSIVHAAIMYMAPADVPKNEGSMRPLSVIAPKGLVVNANPPAPVCMSTNHCGEEIIEAVFKALSVAVPEAVSCGYSRRLRFAITGDDPRTGREFIWHFFLGRGGGGATSGFDGWSNIGSVNVAGGTRAPSVEVTEERFPLFVRRHEMRPGSAGDGRWRGGLGAVCEMVYEGAREARLNTAGDGVVVPPFGLFGGQPGKPHKYSLISNGTERILKSKEAGIIVKPSDTILCLSSGGGGYGEPRKRSAEQRDRDRQNGYVV